MNLCQSCKHAFVSDGTTVITTNKGNTFIQNGKNSSFCTLSAMEDGLKANISIDMSGGKMEMKCSAYEPKNGVVGNVVAAIEEK